MLDLGYERDKFITGDSLLSLTIFEYELWAYYYVYVKRSKTDRLEEPMAYSALFSSAGKTRSPIKFKQLKAQVHKPKISSAMEMFYRGGEINKRMGKDKKE